MAFPKFLLTMGIIAVGFFIGGNFTRLSTPPKISILFWQVTKLAEGRWEVSNTQGQWIVEKIGSELRITALQKC